MPHELGHAPTSSSIVANTTIAILTVASQNDLNPTNNKDGDDRPFFDLAFKKEEGENSKDAPENPNGDGDDHNDEVVQLPILVTHIVSVLLCQKMVKSGRRMRRRTDA